MGRVKGRKGREEEIWRWLRELSSRTSGRNMLNLEQLNVEPARRKYPRFVFRFVNIIFRNLYNLTMQLRAGFFNKDK